MAMTRKQLARFDGHTGKSTGRCDCKAYALAYAVFCSDMCVTSAYLAQGKPMHNHLARQGFQSIILLVRRSFGKNAALIAILHFILLCFNTARYFHFHMFFSFFRTSSIRYTSFSLMSNSSSWSSWKETSLSWSLFEHCSEPSSVSLWVTQSGSFSSYFSSLSIFLSFAFPFSLSCSISSFVPMRRSIFLSCFWDSVHVPLDAKEG